MDTAWTDSMTLSLFSSFNTSVSTSAMSTILKGFMGSGPSITIIGEISILDCFVLQMEKIQPRPLIQSFWSSIHFEMTICIVQFIHSTKPFTYGGSYVLEQMDL